MWLVKVLFVLVITCYIIRELKGLELPKSVPELKGAMGERRVANQLEKLPKQSYTILNDIMLATKKGISQIDHIVISPYAVFVIETKNYSGWIFGSEDSEYWVQSFRKKKVRFRNPIKQNWGHVYALQEALPEYKQVPFHSVIVFTGSGLLKNVNTTTDVIYGNHLYDTIIGYEEDIENITVEDMELIANRLKEITITDETAREQHIKQIRSNIEDTQAKIRAMICPKCSGTLAKRSGPYGEFYGCSNYPKCRYKTKQGAVLDT